MKSNISSGRRIQEKYPGSGRILCRSLALSLPVFFCFLLFVTAILPIHEALADDPVVTLEPGYGSSTDTYRLVVTISGKSSNQLAEPVFEESENFDISQIGTNTRNQFINGDQSFQISFSYRVSLKKVLPPGTYDLPPGSISIDGTKSLLKSVKLTILPDANLPKAKEFEKDNEHTSTGLAFTQLVDNEAPYVGEQTIYRAEIATSLPVTRANLGDIGFEGFWHESFGKNQERRRTVGDTAMYSVLDAIFPTTPGKVEIPPRTLDAEVRIARPQRRRSLDIFEDLFDDFEPFANLQTVSRHLTTSKLELNVKPLPPAPETMQRSYIPVGAVQLSSRFDQTKVKEGESVNLVIEVYGDANLRPLELPDPAGVDSKEITIYKDQPKIDVQQVHDRLYFKKTFQLAIIPHKSGQITLPVFEIPIFDPKAGNYKLLRSDHYTINVSPPEEKEKLIIKGNLPAENGDADSNKQDIQVMGEDLYPIHLGEATLEVPAQHSRERDSVIILVVPLFVLGIITINNRKRKTEAEPYRLRQKHAAEHAFEKLSSSNSPEEHLSILRKFLGDRFLVEGDSLTSEDISTRLVDQGLPQQFVKSTSELLTILQRAVYGGNQRDSGQAATLKEEIKKLIQEIERDVS